MWIQRQKLAERPLIDHQSAGDQFATPGQQFLLFHAQVQANAFVRIVTEPLGIADYCQKQIEPLSWAAASSKVPVGYKSLIQPAEAGWQVADACGVNRIFFHADVCLMPFQWL